MWPAEFFLFAAPENFEQLEPQIYWKLVASVCLKYYRNIASDMILNRNFEESLRVACDWVGI